MIKGIGTDLVDIKRIEKAQKQRPDFASRVLTASEREAMEANSSWKRQMEFLSGRWAAKEAFAKALGTGIGLALSFQDLEILNDPKGRPCLNTAVYSGKIFLSITHTDDYAQAFVVLEE
ncbi:holo-ACP synthase [Aerococcus urinae]|uniref:Holo-[acyl-carrier-protein] synthase n=1 Tax=Aerococcus mictus TaxID=2976810 RepID=A0A1E9PIH6_9LACT|nr:MULTISPECIES: holo-ACP synthase [Aerococcus]KAA9293220.1 holo-ACP synthase [Aerococcus mictus]MCY3034710.1 holo-ACP synthase [Aerococcus mictus]MCY3063664.1 holo-ACP synthase [Aerococcus mictus]MCY3065870.1 holo-ACP synthase [Aerococcus mictus]MCY3067563.1 holo-ACP synthase [Aerococcus mictus]